MAPIELDLRRDLPKVREQYATLILNLGQCRYAAPCAIGVMVPEDRREELDKLEVVEGFGGANIRALYDASAVKFPNSEQATDARRLQVTFDGGRADHFEEYLGRLEAKYLPASGIEGEAGDAEERLHPEGESPAPEGGDAQGLTP